MSSGGEIAFVDVETTVPFQGEGYALLELAVILVCPRTLVEIESFSTLVRPRSLSLISAFSIRSNGINREDVSSAPSFLEIADRVYGLLHGRVWAGHNIERFDCTRILEAFAEIGRPAPEPKATIDSLPLLTRRFGRRAGNMKLASLGAYFGLGQQKHRSLDDVRMNLEVIKHCATVLFLESSFPNLFTSVCLISSPSAAECHDTINTSRERKGKTLINAHHIETDNDRMVATCTSCNVAGDIPDLIEPNLPVSEAYPVEILSAIDQMKIDTSIPETTVEEKTASDVPVEITELAASENCTGYGSFLKCEEVSIPSIRASTIPSHRGSLKIALLHKDVPLQLFYVNLRVCFGSTSKYLDHSGRPRLSIVAGAPPSLCQVLDHCDHLAHDLSLSMGSSSEWKPVVMRNHNFPPTFRLNVPTTGSEGTAASSLEIFLKEPSGDTQRIAFNSTNVSEFDLLFAKGNLFDAYFSLDAYDYQQHAGIRLVARRLVVHTK